MNFCRDKINLVTIKELYEDARRFNAPYLKQFQRHPAWPKFQIKKTRSCENCCYLCPNSIIIQINKHKYTTAEHLLNYSINFTPVPYCYLGFPIKIYLNDSGYYNIKPESLCIPYHCNIRSWYYGQSMDGGYNSPPYSHDLKDYLKKLRFYST